VTRENDARLQSLLGGDHLRPLRNRLRSRFARAPIDNALARIRIDKLTPAEHATLASLLGRPRHYTGSLQFEIAPLDETFRRAGIAQSLRDALEQLDGPIVHLATLRGRQEALWEEVVRDCADPELRSFLSAPNGLGLLKRLTRQDAPAATLLVCRAAAVLVRLPASGLTRAQLAAETLGDAHALDDGQAPTSLILAVWRQQIAPAGEGTSDNDDQSLTTQEPNREIWARAGVLVNELARPALLLNLPAAGTNTGTQADSEPIYVSLRTLLRSPPRWNVEGRIIYVCENPNLLAIAADRLGSAGAPLVCTEGMPAAAQQTLLIQLTRAGAQLRYHGDFDWPGMRIGGYVMRAFGAKPWRFGACDYEEAVRAAPDHKTPLASAPAETPWDNALSAAMRHHGIAIAEEALTEVLLQDLARP
jgi:uncharacterized protein (TIGR02679 family)